MTRHEPHGCPQPYDTILESIADGVFTVDERWRITYFNRAAEEMIGISRDEALGRPCWEVFHADICEQGCALRQTMETGENLVNKPATIIRRDGESLTVSLSTALLRNEEGEVVGGVETFRDLSDVETLRKELEHRHSYGDIITQNDRMRELLDVLPQVALSDATVVIQGESGTGKELFARAIHNLSSRHTGPFVAVNAAALPDSLLESELFGHVAGAFTDARTDRKGRFQEAHGGTLLLDEIGDVSPALQVKLLRVLEEQAFEPVGSSKTLEVDTRVVVATNKDLGALVEEGAFRRDLFYRLSVVTLEIPPLRDRREDIPLLVNHLIGRFNALKGRNIVQASQEAISVLMSHSFPGNVRELANCVEHAFVLCTGDTILPAHLPPHVRGAGHGLHGLSSVGSLAVGAPEKRPDDPKKPTDGGATQTLDRVEASLVREALLRNRGNRAATARELGVHTTTLWRKMKKWGIPKDFGRE